MGYGRGRNEPQVEVRRGPSIRQRLDEMNGNTRQDGYNQRQGAPREHRNIPPTMRGMNGGKSMMNASTQLRRQSNKVNAPYLNKCLDQVITIKERAEEILTGKLVAYDDYSLRITDNETGQDVLIFKFPGLLMIPNFDFPKMPPRETPEQRKARYEAMQQQQRT